MASLNFTRPFDESGLEESRDSLIIVPSNNNEPPGDDFENQARRQEAGDVLLALSRQRPLDEPNDSGDGSSAPAGGNGIQRDNVPLQPCADVVPTVLSPPRSFFNEDLQDLIPKEDILEIIQNVDLMKRASIMSNIPFRRPWTVDENQRFLQGLKKPADSICESRYPKPPNHVIAGVGIEHSWPEAILSMAGFWLIPLSEQKREVQKASKLLSKSEKTKYLRRIKMFLENRNPNHRYDPHARPTGGRKRRCSSSHRVSLPLWQSVGTASPVKNEEGGPQQQAQQLIEAVQHVGLASSQEARDELISQWQKSQWKRRKLGENAPSIAAQADGVALHAADRAFLQVAKAMDTTYCPDRADSDPGNSFVAIQFCDVKQSNHCGGKLTNADCVAEKPTLRMLTESAAMSKRVLGAFQEYCACKGATSFSIKINLRQDRHSFHESVQQKRI